MNEPLESLRPPPVRPSQTDRAPAGSPLRSPRLAWAITLGESALLAGAAIPLYKYWLMFPAPVRLGGATLLAALALLVIFRIVRYHLRWSRHRNNAHTITRPPEGEPEPAPALTPANAALAVPEKLPCQKRLRHSTVLMPSGSSTCP